MARLVEDMILLTKTDRPGFLSTGPVLDKQRVTQALLQLAHNVVNHTAPGDTVALGASDQGRSVRLWVRDTGDGVPDEEKESIFRRFSRGVDEANVDGVGLGLSIVVAIAAVHGGTAHVEDGHRMADPEEHGS
jgi:two-component system, OmpR family, sensor kinase